MPEQRTIQFTIDIELTNRCNAKCHFCPRDLTPHQGLMKPEVFTRSLSRAVEYRDGVRASDGAHHFVVSLCGLGEPLLNRNAASFVSDVREADIECHMSTNGSLLDERRGTALLDAGLEKIWINVGDRDATYEDVYHLPFERTRDNVVRFLEMAEGRCDVFIVLVNYRRDARHQEEMEAFWRDLGAKCFAKWDIMNRGGSLFVDDMQFQSFPQVPEAREVLAGAGVAPTCAAPFGYLFIGYDGNYYLCCSDWQKEVPLGSVFDTSLMAITRQKMQHVLSREPICKSCNHDPINRMAHELRAIEAGEVDPSSRDELLAELNANNEMVQSALDIMETMEHKMPPDRVRHSVPKRLIPVSGD